MSCNGVARDISEDESAIQRMNLQISVRTFNPIAQYAIIGQLIPAFERIDPI
jgi:hypothetical protein